MNGKYFIIKILFESLLISPFSICAPVFSSFHLILLIIMIMFVSLAIVCCALLHNRNAGLISKSNWADYWLKDTNWREWKKKKKRTRIGLPMLLMPVLCVCASQPMRFLYLYISAIRSKTSWNQIYENKQSAYSFELVDTPGDTHKHIYKPE